MRRIEEQRLGRALTRCRLPLLAALVVLSAAACDTKRILEVEDPDVARPSALQGEDALPALFAGALGDFGNAYNGNSSEGQVVLSGLLADEFINTETFPTRIEIDQRRQQPQSNSTLSDLFYDINRARASADRAAAAYQQFDPTALEYAEVLNLSGLTYVLFAENYCGAVPVSNQAPDGSFQYGPPLTTEQLLDSAVSKFDQALAIAQASDADDKDTQIFLAQVGKGRALLDKADYAGAAAAVAGVPTTFQFIYEHSETTGRQNNGTWSLTANVGRFGVGDGEGINGLPFVTEGDINDTTRAPDPRVPNFLRPRDGGKGFDGTTTQFVQGKYLLRASPIVVADGVEARLIEAEAALQTDPSAALGILNDLRSDADLLDLRGYPAGSLPPLTLQSTKDAQVDQLFKERAYWLWLTSHRLGDLRRLIRQYGRTQDQVFPTGSYHKGGTYGTDVNSPVPQEEQNNPNYDPAACKADVA